MQQAEKSTTPLLRIFQKIGPLDSTSVSCPEPKADMIFSSGAQPIRTYSCNCLSLRFAFFGANLHRRLHLLQGKLLQKRCFVKQTKNAIDRLAISPVKPMKVPPQLGIHQCGSLRHLIRVSWHRISCNNPLTVVAFKNNDSYRNVTSLYIKIRALHS